MPVTKVSAPVRVPARVEPVRKIAISPTKAAEALTLPTAPKEPDHDLLHYTMLLYGREKIGKTTLLKSFPDAIFFTTEPGTKGLRIYEFNAEDGACKNWDIFRKGVALLKANPGRFKTVVIDTVDRAYDMCLDWVCENRNIEYPGQSEDGTEDYGKSWRAVKMEFLEQIHAIIQSGRGVCFTSHAKEQTIKTRSGDRYSRIFPTMSNQARAIVEAIVDLFFYAEYIRDERILICRGDETIWAGARETVTNEFPQFLPMTKEGGYDIILKAFLGQYKGLDPATIIPGKATTETAKEFLRKQRTKLAISPK